MLKAHSPIFKTRSEAPVVQDSEGNVNIHSLEQTQAKFSFRYLPKKMKKIRWAWDSKLQSFLRPALELRSGLMMTLPKLTERRREILRLAERYHAADVRVFGSVARGEATDGSDVDLLINTKPGCSLFDLGGLLEDLKELLGCPVDLVTEDGLKPRLRERVLREAVPL